MNLELSEQVQTFARSRVETGHFSDKGEAVTYHLETLRAQEIVKELEG